MFVESPACLTTNRPDPPLFFLLLFVVAAMEAPNGQGGIVILEVKSVLFFLKFILCFLMFDCTSLKYPVGGTSVFP